MISLSLIDVEQFTIIVVCLFCMGAGTGFERSLLPRMAVQTFHQNSSATRLNFVATFGLAKAVANAISGPLADRFGRKPTLVLGFLIGLPVMPYIIVAQSWTGVTIMNIAFGLSQGLLGSALFFLLIDLMGPTRRGIAVGIGECMIYVSTALVNVLAGHIASKYGYRPVPFTVATGFAILGLLITIPLHDTLDLVQSEQTELQRQMRKKYARLASIQPSILDEERELIRKNTFESIATAENGSIIGSTRECGSIYGSTRAYGTPMASIRNLSEHLFGNISFIFSEEEDEEDPSEPHPPLKVLLKLICTNSNFVALCFTGLVINFKDGFAWGSFPVFFCHEHDLTDKQTDLLVALYPLCWGFSQAFTGALSDKFGRKRFLVAGTASCALSMALYTLPCYLWGEVGDERHVSVWLFCDVLLGLGTALAYPALQAGAADEVDPVNRGVALGFYRFTRDFGYTVGAIVCGRLTDAVGYDATFMVVALALSASVVAMEFVYTPNPDFQLATGAAADVMSLERMDTGFTAKRKTRTLNDFYIKYSDSL